MSPLSTLLRSTWKKKSKGHLSPEHTIPEEENGLWDFGGRQSEDGQWLTSANGQRVQQGDKWHQASSSAPRKLETRPPLPSSSNSSVYPSSSTSSPSASSHSRSAGPLSNGIRSKGHDHGNLDSVDDEIVSKVSRVHTV